MRSPEEMFKTLKNRIKEASLVAFWSALILGLLIHLPVMLSDIPNHDGLASMYFDQNMITSGRWFLGVACGFSSYYTVPWVIGLIGTLWLALTAAVLVDLLEIDKNWLAAAVAGVLVSFPALASTYAYVFTMDGYMFAMFASVLAVWLCGRGRLGWIWGAVALSLAVGTYQAYLPISILLCIYVCAIRFIDTTETRDRLVTLGRNLGMGIGGMGLYYVILQVLLKIQGKELDTYQGINGLELGDRAGGSLLGTIKGMYGDFINFTIKGDVFVSNIFECAAIIILAIALVVTVIALFTAKKLWIRPLTYVITVLVALLVPVASEAVVLISADVNFHLLMRYQWMLLIILPLAFINKYGENIRPVKNGLVSWMLLVCSVIIVFSYGLADNIAYTNLERKYEKTYAFCLRLLDRIEETEGYYQGIPVAIVGVVGDHEYPVTDITERVTGNMIGITGDYLVYTGANYEAFMKNYMGATLNFVDNSFIQEMYYSEEYMAMESFPGATSVKIVNGIMYVKTENFER